MTELCTWYKCFNHVTTLFHLNFLLSTASSLDDEMVQNTSFCSHGVFSDKLALTVGIAASFLLALVIYVYVGNLLKPSSHHFKTSSEHNLYLVKHPLALVLSLYIFHQLAHWAMTYYSQTHLRRSNSLQPFHYLMAGMNLVFVLLYVTQCYLIPDRLFYRDAIDLNWGIWGLYLWIIIAKSYRRGFVFGYSIPYAQGVSEFYEKWLPYYFSFVILLNFWYKPFTEGLFFVRISLDLIFITHSCLIQTHIYENKYWTLFLELMVISYFILKVNADSIVDYSLITSVYITVFVISQMHEFSFFTRMMKFLIIMIALICLAGCVYFWNFRIDSLFIVLSYLYLSCLIFYFTYFLIKIFCY